MTLPMLYAVLAAVMWSMLAGRSGIDLVAVEASMGSKVQ